MRGASLKSLTLSACEDVIAAGLSELSTMRQLMSLSLAWCNVTDEVIVALSSLPNLTCLTLTHCTPTPNISGVTDVGACALSGSRLTSLDLSWTGVTDEGAAALMDVATLTHLDVGWTAVTKPGVESLLQSRPSDRPELTVKYKKRASDECTRWVVDHIFRWEAVRKPSAAVEPFSFNIHLFLGESTAAP